MNWDHERFFRALTDRVTDAGIGAAAAVASQPGDVRLVLISGAVTGTLGSARSAAWYWQEQRRAGDVEERLAIEHEREEELESMLGEELKYLEGRRADLASQKARLLQEHDRGYRREHLEGELLRINQRIEPLRAETEGLRERKEARELASTRLGKLSGDDRDRLVDESEQRLYATGGAFGAAEHARIRREVELGQERMREESRRQEAVRTEPKQEADLDEAIMAASQRKDEALARMQQLARTDEDEAWRAAKIAFDDAMKEENELRRRLEGPDQGRRQKV